MVDQSKNPPAGAPDRDPETARLWALARQEWRAEGVPTAPDGNDLAAYLEGRADAKTAAHIEAWLLASPRGAEILAAGRTALAERPLAPPAELIARARGLVREPRTASAAPGPRLVGLGGMLAVLFPVRRLGFAATFAALVVASYGSFSLGQFSIDQAEAIESALADEESFGLASAFEEPL